MEATDVFQITLQSALAQIQGFRPTSASSLLQWLSTIATHKIRDEFDRLIADKRNVQREIAIESIRSSSSADGWQPQTKDRSPSAVFFLKEIEALFDEAVHALPDDQRDVVILRDYCGHEWDEIARQLSRETVHAARQLHQRAWIALRGKLGPKLRSSL